MLTQSYEDDCRISESIHSAVQILSPNIFILMWLFLRVRVIVFNATFNNISVISWQSVLSVEETGVPRENHLLKILL
jgi:hypothetical protein